MQNTEASAPHHQKISKTTELPVDPPAVPLKIVFCPTVVVL